jgi:hypothetical protein
MKCDARLWARILFPKVPLMNEQKLHLVMGGRVSDPQGLEFVDLENLDLVGVYGDYASAEEAWRDKARRTVDDAEMKYVVVHLHRLLQPDMLKR